MSHTACETNVSDLYFEVHITIDPCLDKAFRSELEDLGKEYGFRMAKLVKDNGELSDKDSFFTTRSQGKETLGSVKQRMLAFVDSLRLAGATVRRFKIEDTLLDTKLQPDLLYT